MKTVLLAGIAMLASVAAQAAPAVPALLVPEPGSLLLLGAGIGVLALRLRRR